MIHLLRSKTRRQIQNRQQKLNLSSQNAGVGFGFFFKSEMQPVSHCTETQVSCCFKPAGTALLFILHKGVTSPLLQTKHSFASVN